MFKMKHCNSEHAHVQVNLCKLGEVLKRLKHSHDRGYFQMSWEKDIHTCEVRLCSHLLSFTFSNLIKLFLLNNKLNALEIIWVVCSTEFVSGCESYVHQFERDDELASTLIDMPAPYA